MGTGYAETQSASSWVAHRQTFQRGTNLLPLDVCCRWEFRSLFFTALPTILFQLRWRAPIPKPPAMRETVSSSLNWRMRDTWIISIHAAKPMQLSAIGCSGFSWFLNRHHRRHRFQIYTRTLGVTD